MIRSILIAGGGRTRVRELSPGPGTYYHPVVVTTGPASGRVFWMQFDGSIWRIATRSWHDEDWTPVAYVAENAMFPSAVVVGGEVLLVWEDYSGPQEEIRIRVWNDREWSTPFGVSDATYSSRRAALCATRGEDVWAFWDSYDGKEYGVYGRQVRPRLGPIERISPAGKDCLNASSASLSDGTVAAAWVSTAAVKTKGIIDHRDALQVAVHRGGNWSVTTSEGQPDIADLRQSLLARMEPKAQPVFGYYGNRHHPMLAADGNTLWLLWEQKIHFNDGSMRPGELVGKHLVGDKWSSSVVLNEGLVDYQIPSEARADHGVMLITGRNTDNYFSSFQLDFSRGRELEKESYTWSEWQPVQLPLGPRAARTSIELDGKQYFLYWGTFMFTAT